MSSETPISRFYKQVDDFKHKLCRILEDLNKVSEAHDLRKHYEKMMLFKSANSKMVIEFFYKHVVEKYAFEIVQKNDEFFLGKLSDVREGERDNLSDHDFMLLGHIKDIWHELPEKVRNNIWLYILIISKLAEIVTNGTAIKNAESQ